MLRAVEMAFAIHIRQFTSFPVAEFRVPVRLHVCVLMLFV